MPFPNDLCLSCLCACGEQTSERRKGASDLEEFYKISRTNPVAMLPTNSRAKWTNTFSMLAVANRLSLYRGCFI